MQAYPVMKFHLPKPMASRNTDPRTSESRNKSINTIIIWQTLSSKTLCSDWFFLGQDFAVWFCNPCIFVLERKRQILNLQLNNSEKKKL